MLKSLQRKQAVPKAPIAIAVSITSLITCAFSTAIAIQIEARNEPHLDVDKASHDKESEK